MEINSKLLGKIEYREESVINIEEGLIGLSENKSFLFIEQEDFKPFAYLQSIDDPSFTLITINPFLVDAGYSIDINRDDLKSIDAEKREDFVLLAIVVFANKAENITVNLKAPLIINITNKKCKQVILQSSLYTVADPLCRIIPEPEDLKKQEGT